MPGRKLLFTLDLMSVRPFFFSRFHVILFYFDMQRVLSLLKINE